MSWRSFRERVNITLYDSKAKVLHVLKVLNLVISLTALFSLTYYYGFPVIDTSEFYVFGIIRMSFLFYVLQYLIHFFYDFQPLRFLRDNWFEGLIMLLLVLEGIAHTLTGTLLIPQLFVRSGWENFPTFTTLFIQVYFLVAMVTELSRSGGMMPNLRIHPSNLFMLVFLLLILIGTLLLMMPEMTPGSGYLNFLDALFTSTSATCVTGLTVLNTAEAFTFKGQFVIMMLIKLGGLNIIAFGIFVSIAGRIGLSVKQHEVIEDFVNERSVLSGQKLIGKVFLWSLVIEGLGALLLFLFWSDELPFRDVGDRFFHSLFHSFSAFNHAGFNIIGEGGLYHEAVRTNYLVHIVIGGLILVSSLGFVALFDLFTISKMRERLRYPWQQLDFHTKISIYTAVGLVLFGFLFFMILEWNGALEGKTLFGSLVSSFFQSITTRTAGFSTVDTGALSIPMIVIFMFLMLIGGSSSSPAGGIKTTTFGLIWGSVMATIRSFKNVELFKRTVSQDLVLRGFTILLFFLFGIFTGTFLLSLTEEHILAMDGMNMMDLIFEEVSAFGTVGLSTGVTPHLSWLGKIVLIVSMFVGRVGTLTVAFALTSSVISRNYKYPYGHTMVG
ncbi:MAG: TrkH family potassium uptake protein [Flavobacteriales bacterium]